MLKEKFLKMKEKMMRVENKVAVGTAMALSTLGFGYCDEASAALSKVMNMIFNIAKAGGTILALAGLIGIVKIALPSDEGPGANAGQYLKGGAFIFMGAVLIGAKWLLTTLFGFDPTNITLI